MSPQDISTAAVVVHLVALGLGAGGALITDFYIVRHAMMRPITEGVAETVEFLGTMVSIGLVLLWASGIYLAIELYLAKPTFVTNEKFWAKVVIVAVLTINGWNIHHRILPLLKSQVGRKLFDGLSPATVQFLAIVGAISIVSWMFPLVLGTARQLNYVTPIEVILGFYLLALLAALFGNCAIILLLSTIGRAVASGAEQAPLPAASVRMASSAVRARAVGAPPKPKSGIEPDRMSLVVGRANKLAAERLAAARAEIKAAHERLRTSPAPEPSRRRAAA
jgi:hypothetical protein